MDHLDRYVTNPPPRPPICGRCGAPLVGPRCVCGGLAALTPRAATPTPAPYPAPPAPGWRPSPPPLPMLTILVATGAFLAAAGLAALVFAELVLGMRAWHVVPTPLTVAVMVAFVVGGIGVWRGLGWGAITTIVASALVAWVLMREFDRQARTMTEDASNALLMGAMAALGGAGMAVSLLPGFSRRAAWLRAARMFGWR